MKRAIQILTFALILSLSGSVAQGLEDSAIPVTLWDKPSDGIATAMMFSNSEENGAKKSVITVYMKNTSDISMYYIGTEGFHREVAIYLIDKSGKETPLRDYNWPGGSRISAPEIKPGEVLSRTIDLSPDEIAKIKGQPIKCRLNFVRASGNKRLISYVIESTPKTLVGVP